mgnify:CR=1 FL=1
MERNKAMLKTGCVKILWAVLTVLLCVSAFVWAETHFDVGPYTVNNQIIGEVYVYSGVSVTLVGDAHIADDPDPSGEKGNMYVMGIVDFYAGIVDGFIDVWDGTITVYGTGFEDSSGPISATQWTPAGGSDTLTGTYESGEPISLLFNSNTAINLVDTGGGTGPELITIDIKPGCTPNAINLGSNGVIPVAILSTADLDATTINPDTVFLAGSGVAVRGKGNKLLASEEDVNGDGLIDLVVKVETENLDPGSFQDGYAILQVIVDNIVIYEGSDEITIVPPE